MKILMVNKFLYPNGGSETYVLKLGGYLTSLGHEIQYFGMNDARNEVGNRWDIYTSKMDFHSENSWRSAISPFKLIYSVEARKKIRILLREFRPDIVHLNNINFQLTPAIIYEIKKQKIPVVQTVHDAQIVCPIHRLYNEATGMICEKCIGGKYYNCFCEKCLHGSRVKSLIAAVESYYYHIRNTYNLVDGYICPSKFIARKVIQGGISKEKIAVLYNFADDVQASGKAVKRPPYVLYFGRLSKEKGLGTLLTVCKKEPQIRFVFAGSGPMAKNLVGMENVDYVGFKDGEELANLIRNAEFTVYPSECYENCPLSIIESQKLGVPVIGSNLGGIKELIVPGETGYLFEGGNAELLQNAIKKLWESQDLKKIMKQCCLLRKNNCIDFYANRLVEIYILKAQNRKPFF